MVPGFRRHLSDQISEANQGRGSILHDLRRLRPHQSGPESGRVDSPDRTEIGHHLSFGRAATARAPGSTKSPAWRGPARAPSAASRSPPTAARAGRMPSFGPRPFPWRIPDLASTGNGTEKNACSCRAALTSWARFNPREPTSRNTGTNPRTKSRFEAPTTAFNPGVSPPTGAFTMDLRRLLLVTAILGICQTGWTQSPTYGLGRTPSAG